VRTGEADGFFDRTGQFELFVALATPAVVGKGGKRADGCGGGERGNQHSGGHAKSPWRKDAVPSDDNREQGDRAIGVDEGR
jgi:hypothetical protein